MIYVLIITNIITLTLMFYLVHRCRKSSKLFHKKMKQKEFQVKCLNDKIEQLNRDIDDYFYKHRFEEECSRYLESWLSSEINNIALALMKFNVPTNLVRQIIYTNAIEFKKYGISVQRIMPDFSKLSFEVYKYR